MRNGSPDAPEQRCWNHQFLNALDTGPKPRQAHARLLLTQIPYAQTQQDAERVKTKDQAWYRTQGLAEAAQVVDRDWDREPADE